MNEENTEKQNAQKKLDDQEAKRLADEKWAAEKTKQLANDGKKEEENRKLLEFIMKEAEANKKAKAQQSQSSNEQPLESPFQIQKPQEEINNTNVNPTLPIVDGKKIIPQPIEFNRVPNPLENIGNILKNTKDNLIPDGKDKPSDIISKAIVETAAKLSRLFVSRDEVRQIAKDANPTDAVPQTWLTKTIARIKYGASYLSGGVIEFKATGDASISVDNTVHPNTLTINSTHVDPPLPSIVNHINGAGVLYNGDVVVQGGDGITVEAALNANGIKITNQNPTAGVESIKTPGESEITGDVIIQGDYDGDPENIIDVTQSGKTLQVSSSYHPTETVAGTEPATSMYALTNFSFIARADGTYLQFAGCRIKADPITVAGWQEFGPIPGTGGESGVTSVNNSAGDVGIIAGTANVTIGGGNGSPITISVSASGTSGCSGDLIYVKNVWFDNATGTLWRSKQKLTFLNGLLITQLDLADETVTTAEACS